MTLCSEVWCLECKEIGLVFTELSAVVFLGLIQEGKLSKQQSILRCRRNWNQKKPELKGKSYKAKTKKKPDYIKHKPLPNLLKRAGLSEFDPDSLIPKHLVPASPT
jgi:hypothetical protein